MDERPAGSTSDLTIAPDSRRCDNCGAPVRFDPATADLRCRHCRSAVAIDAPVAAVGELDYAAVVAANPGAASTGDDIEAVRLQCAACGAPSDHPPNTLASACPYCRNPFVGTPASTRTLAPDGILPLTVTEDQARASTRAWLGNRWFAPRHLDKVATDALRSQYSPAWVFSMATTAAYRGRRGDNYLDTETYTTTDANGNTTTATRTVTKVRWRSASGSVHLRFRDVIAYAGTGPIARHGTDLEPWGIEHVSPYDDDFLRGSGAQTYTAPPGAGLIRARERTADAVEDTIRDDIGGDHQEIHDVDRRDQEVRFRYVMLPGWEATYRHRDDTYELAVNGRTGTVAGTRPYSKVKIAIAVGVAVAVVAVAVFLLTRANSTPPPSTTPRTTVVVPTTRPPTTAEPVAPTTAPLSEPVPTTASDPAAIAPEAPTSTTGPEPTANGP